MNDYVKNKWVYSLIWLAVIAIVIWIIAGTRQNYESEIQVNQETYTIESTEEKSTVKQSEAVSGYYLVRADGESVKVYWIDDAGEHLHRETSIAYPIMSLEDQKLLDEGIKLQSDEELSNFLENYDS